ncbi:MAG: hypothetical protein HUK22_07560, partial [Thermoguttaceae bacterium]|nr:hypothetical protein [Thermoguttaceae bacterium]
ARPPAPKREVVARWNPKTTDWSRNPNPKIGDWGFDRPGYPKGLYICGITVKSGEKVFNPAIYDNDVWDDVFDDELAFAMAAAGEMNLAAQIVTPVLTDGWDFYHPDWPQTALDSRDAALRSGLNPSRIPAPVVGTEAASEKAGERKDSAGARLYVKIINEQFKKDPSRPTIVNIGGQSATLASAYCIDPTIAEKCVVYYTDAPVYNGHYEWASKLVCKHFRVVNFGEPQCWWPRRRSQAEWVVLPRPEFADASKNDENSGEWKALTDMHKPMLDAMVRSFQSRGEYCDGDSLGDGYLDGTFFHAYYPGMFTDAELKELRGENTEGIYILGFPESSQKAFKEFANKRLLDPKIYQ